MGTGYTRNDTTNNIADGNIIDAADLDGEFDAIQSAFNASTGHTHDGTSAEGAPITVTGPAQEYVSTAAELRPKTNNTYDLGSLALQWRNLYVDGTAYLDAVDIDGGSIDGTAIGASSAAAGNFTTLISNNATVNGNITVTGTVDGRDVAADGSKLDGIESGATADQTAGEILTAIKTVDGAASGLDADLLDGQQGSYYLDANNFVNMPAGYTGWTISDGTNSESITDGSSVNFVGSGSATVSYNTSTNTVTISSTDTNENTTYTAGGGLTLSGTVFSHTDTSSQSSVNNSGNTFIQDITLDTYGHITSINSATVTVNDATITLAAGSGLIGGGNFTTNQGGNETITFNIDLNELATSTTNGDGDYFVVVDTSGVERKLTKGNINISGFNNDAGYTTNVGDITGVTAGSGLTGGGTSGSVTVSHSDTSALSGTYGSTANGTKIDQITVDEFGHVTAITTGATGDIDGVTAGTGLTGGGTSGTVTLNVDVGTTANKIVQLDASARLPAVDGSQLTGIQAGAGYFQGENGNTGDTTNGKGDIFRTHESTLNTNVTIASGDNSLAAGPLTVASGVTLTVSGNLSIV